MFDSYEAWVSLWAVLGLLILYWSTFRTKGHLVAGMGTAVTALVLLLIVFANQLVGLMGRGQWVVLLFSTMGLACGFLYWFSKKYVKPPQKQ
jgi:hypothetical protein